MTGYYAVVSKSAVGFSRGGQGEGVEENFFFFFFFLT